MNTCHIHTYIHTYIHKWIYNAQHSQAKLESEAYHILVIHIYAFKITLNLKFCHLNTMSSITDLRQACTGQHITEKGNEKVQTCFNSCSSFRRSFSFLRMSLSFTLPRWPREDVTSFRFIISASLFTALMNNICTYLLHLPHAFYSVHNKSEMPTMVMSIQ